MSRQLAGDGVAMSSLLVRSGNAPSLRGVVTDPRRALLGALFDGGGLGWLRLGATGHTVRSANARAYKARSRQVAGDDGLRRSTG